MIIAQQFSCLGPRSSNAGVDAVSWSTGCSRNLVSVASNAALPSASARDACSQTRPYDAVRQAGNHVQVDPELMDMSPYSLEFLGHRFRSYRGSASGPPLRTGPSMQLRQWGCARIMMVINWLRNQGMFVVSGSAWPRYRGDP